MSCYRIAPHFLELIKSPVLWQHHMHHHIHIIDQYPLQVLITLMVVRIFIAFFLHLFLYILRDRLYLRLVACFANDEKISYGLIYFF